MIELLTLTAGEAPAHNSLLLPQRLLTRRQPPFRPHPIHLRLYFFQNLNVCSQIARLDAKHPDVDHQRGQSVEQMDPPRPLTPLVRDAGRSGGYRDEHGEDSVRRVAALDVARFPRPVLVGEIVSNANL